jgi:hypothetical protein
MNIHRRYFFRDQKYTLLFTIVNPEDQRVVLNSFEQFILVFKIKNSLEKIKITMQ